MQALAESPYLTRLSSLSLRANDRVTIKGVTSLAKSTTLRHLHSLDLGYIGLKDDAATALAGSASLTNLASLVLVSNKITPEGARTLASSAVLANLAELDMRRNPIGSDGIALLHSKFGRRARLGPRTLPTLS
jgi:hypothetical protein